MVESTLDSFEPIISIVPSVYKLNTISRSYEFSFDNLDKIPHVVKHDFYNLGLTESLNRKRANIETTATYSITGKSVFNNMPRKSLVTLLTFDFKYIDSTFSDVDGNYLFDFLLNQDYIVIAEDLSCEYNHSIQVGVKPIEIL